MTWRQIYEVLLEEIEKQPAKEIDHPPELECKSHIELLNMEMDVRATLDDWIYNYFEGYPFAPLDLYHSYWLLWRLIWARNWVTPLVGSSVADQEAFHDWSGRLLIHCWHAYGAKAWADTIRQVSEPEPDTPSLPSSATPELPPADLGDSFAA